MLVNGVVLLSILYVCFLVIATPKPVEKFTTFYILSPGHTFSDYPQTSPYNISRTFTIGIDNQERDNINYSIFLRNPRGEDIEIRQLYLSHNETLQFPYSVNIDWLNREKIEFLLFKNGEQTNLSLKLWVNGTTFYVLNESGGFEIRTSIPCYYNLPVKLFTMNEFNGTETFKIEFRYVQFGENISSSEPIDTKNVELASNETRLTPYTIWVRKAGANPARFVFSNRNYEKVFDMEINGEVFYLVNSTRGFFLPEQLPVGTNFTVIVGVAYLWYLPGYPPLDFELSHKKLEEGMSIKNATVLNRYEFTLSHSQVMEVPVSQSISLGNNTFVYEINATRFYDAIHLNIIGN